MRNPLRPRHFALGLALLLAAAPLAARTLAARTLVHAGSLIDGRSDEVRRNVTIVIDGERIAAITDGFVAPGAGDTVVDRRNATVMPGLMDMHVHLIGESSPTSYTEKFYMNPADEALRATMYARRTLLAGFTTVRDLGAADKLNLALRDAVAKGWVEGPRIFASSGVATTGGHGDGTNGLNSRLQHLLDDTQTHVADGPEAVRRAVRLAYKNGADLVKISATGGVLSLARSGHAPLFAEDELATVVRTARDYGMKVAAHAHGDEGMQRAIRAGVVSIEHGTYMSDETIRLMKEHGTWFVPTISAGRFVAAKSKLEGYFPAVVRPKAATIGPLMQATFQRAWQSGVKIAFGTDQGVAPHGDNALEFGYMVEAGMPPMQAIRSATLAGAQLLGIENDLGTVEPGKVADLVAVPGDPLADISLMTRVNFVMKAGNIHKQ